MKLYATVTSERASKGQGGNKHVDTIYTNSDKEKVLAIYCQILEHDQVRVRVTVKDYPVFEEIIETKGKKQKDEYCNECMSQTCKQL